MSAVTFPRLGLIRAVVIGVALGSVCVALLGVFLPKHMNVSSTLPLEQALWVCDWNIKKIYGPGTPQQAVVVARLKSTEIANMRFPDPMLYRMGGGDTKNGNEGIIMTPFDPKNPSVALHLKKPAVSSK